MHQSKGHSSSLVLTIRKLNLWELTRVALITLHYRQCSTQSHGLHTIPSPVASNNAACPRWKIANQDSESTTGCGNSSASLVASKLEAYEHPIIDGEIYCGEWPNSARSRIRPRWRPTSVLHRVFRPRPHRLRTIVEFLNLWHRATFIHHGSAMFIASAFVTRVYCLNKLPCAPQRSFFEASADRDELERDVAWLVTALQRVGGMDRWQGQTLTTFFTARPFTTTLTTTLINTHEHSHQHSPSTLTINTHHQHSPSTLTINTHHQHSPSTLTINTHHQHSPSTLTINTHHQHSPSTLTINTHINTRINTHQHSYC
ncbi:hypothetical protein N7497_003713 [Penicillium chrysogenum]|nr:hypothetical protein N7497_003713 [Penicillium chrysogenum]